jgi:tetratricopeptide (TPR) repeat protein
MSNQCQYVRDNHWHPDRLAGFEQRNVHSRDESGQGNLVVSFASKSILSPTPPGTDASQRHPEKQIKMHMIHTVVTLNNRGVAHLEAGDHELARIAFKQALERTTYLLNLKREARQLFGRDCMAVQFGTTPATCRPGESRDESLSSNCITSSSRQRAQQNDIQQRRVDSIQRVPISTLLTSQHTEPFISSHALLLSSDCCTNPAEDEYCHRESACVMFNLALVHHWRGIHFGLSSLLPKALKLYEMSFSLIQNGANFDTQHLVLALLNNMGHIHHELLQYNQARQCFKNLKELLTERAASASDGPDIQGFLMNIMFLEAPPMAPAA